MAKTKKTAVDRMLDWADARSRGPEPGEYDAGGKQVVCPHCGGTAFAEGVAHLQPASMFEEWIFSLACNHCGHIQLFLKRPRRRQNNKVV